MSSANSSASLAAVSEVRIRQELPDLVLDGLLLDREESGKTILEAWDGNVAEFQMTLMLTPTPPQAEAVCLALPYLVLVVIFLQQLLCGKQSRKRPQPTKILYDPGQDDLANLGDCTLAFKIAHDVQFDF